MNIKLVTKLRALHFRFDRELRAEIARRVPDGQRIATLKKLKLVIKDQLSLIAPPRPAMA